MLINIILPLSMQKSLHLLRRTHSNINYILHQHVHHKKNTLRVVFDCSAKMGGKSQLKLNYFVYLKPIVNIFVTKNCGRKPSAVGAHFQTNFWTERTQFTLWLKRPHSTCIVYTLTRRLYVNSFLIFLSRIIHNFFTYCNKIYNYIDKHVYR